MKVMAINSSPHMEKGNTAMILAPFLEGMKEAGAEVETIYTRKLKIAPCEGCFDCWMKTPGVCRHKDDMASILPKMGADTWVYATPLYVDGMTGPMKNFLDRCIPGALPFFEMRDGHNRHPARGGQKQGGKIVLVSTCGFWELDNFDALVIHMKAYAKNANRDFAGALLRPHAGALTAMSKIKGLIDDVFAAARDAGRQLVQTGGMSPETLRTVSRELMPQELYFQNANRSFKQALDANVKQ
jgi:multimeric flavodoxin WrbA